MAPMFSKFVDGDVSPKTSRPVAGGKHQNLCEEHDTIEIQQFFEKAQLTSTKQHPTLEPRLPELLNFPQAIQAEIKHPDANTSENEHIGIMALPKPEDWTNERAGLSLGNGQLRLEIQDWRTSSPTFIAENNPTGSPRCDLEAIITESDLIRIDFKVPTDYPDGMMGILRSIEALFISPKDISMSNIETGSAPAYRESKNPKRGSYYTKWTIPWETSGCRVSWMKAEEDSQTIQFRFVSGRNAIREEQLMVTVDEHDKFYQKISNKDPNTYGKWMALPVRVWLRIQWLMAKTGDIDNQLFGKLPIDDNCPSSTKKRNKGKKQSKRLPKRARESSTIEGSSEHENTNASVVPSPEPSALGQEHTMETVGSQGLTKKLAKEESTQQELIKRGATLRIDTQKSNRRSKGKGKRKCTPSSPGSPGSNSGKKDADQSTECGDQPDLLPGVQHIARQEVPIEQQLAAVAGQQAVNASWLPTPNDLTTPLSASFETARSHISPHTPLPLSSLSCFFTPTSTPRKKAEDDVEGEANEAKIGPAEISDQLRLTPQGVKVGLRGPVSNNKDEVWFSDPEEYLGGHEVQEQVLHRSESFDVASLGRFKSQETASSSPTVDPLLSSRASFSPSITDLAGFRSDEPRSDGTVQPDDQTPAESSRCGKKSAYKRRKQKRRRHKDLLKRQQERSGDTEPPVSSASSSQSNGVEGRSPSPPESFEDKESTPTGKQFGNVGIPSPESQWNFGRIAVLCEKQGCQVLCILRDGVSVVCPKCGPFSEVRYCGKGHLWEDVKMHWLICGTRPVYQQQLLTGSIPYDVLVGPPMLPSLHQWDTPERHRQAVWFSSARDRGDYFVFAEWDDLVKAADAPASHAGLRCSPQIAYIVRLEDAEEKDRRGEGPVPPVPCNLSLFFFTPSLSVPLHSRLPRALIPYNPHHCPFFRLYANPLFLPAAVEHPALVDYLYRLVRDWMRAHNMWASDKDMDSMLRYQMGLEMGNTLDKSCLGLRHACETEWVGANRRHCEDSTCASERRPTFLGNQCMGLGFQRVCEYLESSYWVLRAHRATHPLVSDVVARTCGGGFSEVLSTDRRTFCRGEGWDGAGTGPMELEMP
ncbi:hypothetical protein N7447_005561 [Penicillium robsamsonii]|uniref:uncharacterized protein n=1 Tax=Penicillium robsamsonii TaxID=1792511 RepID=UPI0025497571|nr:uncharacterized protein N7447_005561 [Penicillium robsamsonii]KAJ5823221.1 hypothetical protein N7447_005561 [Penicillium robsamsonii]